jgi:hypothetical protein
MITTPQGLRSIRAVAINVAPEAVEPFIEDAEKQDVLPVIGADLYFKIEGDPDNEEYKTLLYGGTFAGCDGKSLYTRGLVTAIAYLAYSRMLIFGDIQYTAYGAVLKTPQFSQKPGELDKVRAADSAKKIGLAILQDVAKYIRATHDDACKGASRVSRPKFIAIKKMTL